jgi:hypothetical protein
MKMKGMMVFVTGLLAAAMAQATLIYQDTFSTDGQLSGRAVETGTGTWIADSNLTTSGGVALPAATSTGKDGLLAFTPVADKIYTLSADVHAVSGNWVAIGFLSRTTVPAGSEFFYNLEPTAAPWMYISAAGGLATFSGPSTGGLQNLTGQATSGTMKIVLDTTGSDWVATYYYNSVALRTNTFSGALTINYVGFGGSPTSDLTVDNFTLESIPEPATLGLFSVVGCAVLFLRRQLAM